MCFELVCFFLFELRCFDMLVFLVWFWFVVNLISIRADLVRFEFGLVRLDLSWCWCEFDVGLIWYELLCFYLDLTFALALALAFVWIDSILVWFGLNLFVFDFACFFWFCLVCLLVLMFNCVLFDFDLVWFDLLLVLSLSLMLQLMLMWFVSVRVDLICIDLIWFGFDLCLIWLGFVCFDLIWLGLIWIWVFRFELIRFCLCWFGLPWCELIWLDLVF